MLTILKVRKLLTTGGGLFKTGASIAEQLAAKAIDLWGFTFGRIPYSSTAFVITIEAV